MYQRSALGPILVWGSNPKRGGDSAKGTDRKGRRAVGQVTGQGR
jgi:hypothetical protein